MINSQNKPSQDCRRTQKRKLSEYHDPDYATSASASLLTKRQYKACPDDVGKGDCTSPLDDESCKRPRLLPEIIKREFQREINYKCNQLAKIEERLKRGLELLDRMRYTIMADYYGKHVLPLNSSDMVALRNEHSLLNDDGKGPQLALHPAIKKIVGKKPKTYDEILRTHPKRVVAKTANTSIKFASRMHKKHISNTMLNKGFNIDHCNERTVMVSSPPLISESVNRKHEKEEIFTRPSCLNTTRLNNKTRILIVVGNTSKYVENNQNDRSVAAKNALSYKWLVYVQTRNPDVPLEYFIKRVRFFLHSSYHPHDMVDVNAPPFQIARHGWGEFPVRIQLYFHERLRQKPVQLVHHLLLDKTLSGFQTLGSETIVEVWLCSKVLNTQLVAGHSVIGHSENETSDTAYRQHIEKPNQSSTFLRHNIYKAQEVSNIVGNIIECDSNVAEKKIKPEDTNAKVIEKHKFKLPSAKANNETIAKYKNNSQTSQISSCSEERNTLNNEKVYDLQNAVRAHVKSSAIKTLKSIGANDLKEFSENERNIIGRGTLIVPTILKELPPHKHQNSTKISSKMPDQHGRTQHSAQSLEEEAGGDSKHVQGNSIASRLSNSSSVSHDQSNEDKQIAKCFESNKSAVVHSKLNLDNKGITKNDNHKIVFQKEGKLYIIDPIQMRLKKEQRQQQSLLKPQIRMLKQQQQQQQYMSTDNATAASIACDHNYVSTNPPATVRCKDISKQAMDKSYVTKLKPATAYLQLSSELTFLPTQGSTILYSDRDNYEEMKMKLMRQFMEIKFVDTREAVEYLLRRLPLAKSSENTMARSIFPFVNNRQRYFNVQAFCKMKVYEWLRARFIAKNLRDHPTLCCTTRNNIWTTKEIAFFAQCYGYTPLRHTLKSYLQPIRSNFSQNEKNEKQSISYDAITNWSTSILKNYERLSDTAINNQDTDIDPCIDCDSHCHKSFASDSISTPKKSSKIMYLSKVNYLEEEIVLVKYVCKTIGIDLKPEEITPGVLHPMSQVLIGWCTRILIEKLLRYVYNRKVRQYVVEEEIKESLCIPVEPQDILTTIHQYPDFHFLTNRNLGVLK